MFPAIIGDGITTFEGLLNQDDRASLIAKTYIDRFPGLCGSVLPTGERVRLVKAGTMARVASSVMAAILSEALDDRIDQISRAPPGFFIGCYDIAIRRTRTCNVAKTSRALTEWRRVRGDEHL